MQSIRDDNKALQDNLKIVRDESNKNTKALQDDNKQLRENLKTVHEDNKILNENWKMQEQLSYESSFALTKR